MGEECNVRRRFFQYRTSSVLCCLAQPVFTLLQSFRYQGLFPFSVIAVSLWLSGRQVSEIRESRARCYSSPAWRERRLHALRRRLELSRKSRRGDSDAAGARMHQPQPEEDASLVAAQQSEESRKSGPGQVNTFAAKTAIPRLVSRAFPRRQKACACLCLSECDVYVCRLYICMLTGEKQVQCATCQCLLAPVLRNLFDRRCLPRVTYSTVVLCCVMRGCLIPAPWSCSRCTVCCLFNVLNCRRFSTRLRLRPADASITGI